jgi:phosphatidylcholine synthase
MSSSKLRGYLVHRYTTSTLLFVVLGMVWILDGHDQLALLATAIGLVIDAADGTLARKHRVAQTVPSIDDPLLDNIVDFASYVFLPILFLLLAGLLLQSVWAFATLLAFSSAYGFSRTTAKQSDEGFSVGFPSYWNVVVFYAYVFDLSPAPTSALVVGLSLFVFTGVRFLYVSRLRRGRSLHFVLGSAWGAALLAALFIEPGPLRTILADGALSYVAALVRPGAAEPARGARESTPNGRTQRLTASAETGDAAKRYGRRRPRRAEAALVGAASWFDGLPVVDPADHVLAGGASSRRRPTRVPVHQHRAGGRAAQGVRGRVRAVPRPFPAARAHHDWTTLTAGDLQALLEAAWASRQPLRNVALIGLLLDTGMRAGELGGLRLQDVAPRGGGALDGLRNISGK